MYDMITRHLLLLLGPFVISGSLCLCNAFSWGPRCSCLYKRGALNTLYGSRNSDDVVALFRWIPLTEGEGLLKNREEQVISNMDLKSDPAPDLDPDPLIASTVLFLTRASMIGLFTGGMIVMYKLSIAKLAEYLFNDLAGYLPNPAFYWPLALYPILGSLVVCVLTYIEGPDIRDGIENIAASVEENKYQQYKPLKQVGRLIASIFTLGSGVSLGPEGPSVEIGTGISRLVSDAGKYLPHTAEYTELSSLEEDKNIVYSWPKSLYVPCSPLEKRQLFLAGTSAAVSAGFNAPITGIFFALECGNRYLLKNTMPILQTLEADGRPRADVAAIVLSATLSDIVVDFGLQHTESFSLQGNYYAMLSPLFELPLYLGLGLVCGLISVFFSNLKEFYAEIFNGNDWADALPIAKLPSSIKPLIGGIICGFVAVFYPQTIFAGYSVLDGIISGKTTLDLTLLLQLLFIKIQLSALSMGSGLIGGIFAPALFFGATAGSAYHCVISSGLSAFHALIDPYLSAEFFQYSNRFLTIANSPAYATVGAAATLGAMFRAPLTSSMLLFELTQNHDIVLPVLAATGLAGLFAEIISSTFATATAAATSEEFISTHAELTSTTDEISSM